MSTSELKAKAIGGSEGSHPGSNLGLGKHFVNVSETKKGQLNDPWLLNYSAAILYQSLLYSGQAKS